MGRLYVIFSADW